MRRDAETCCCWYVDAFNRPSALAASGAELAVLLPHKLLIPHSAIHRHRAARPYYGYAALCCVSRIFAFC